MVAVLESPISGLVVVELDVHGDARGWFKENWQREKMVGLGLPDFRPVQNNVSFNATRGVTRGFHAEPWDKFVSVAAGRAFGAWVDLREGPGFGMTFSVELGPDRAVFVPRGVANSFQVLEDGTAYSYLVTAHWRPGAGYPEVSLADPEIAMPWPIPLTDPAVELSAKDAANPPLSEVRPIPASALSSAADGERAGGTLVIGCRGQLGRALMAALPDAVGVDLEELHIGRPEEIAGFDFSPFSTVINAAAYTAVDAAETAEGRAAAWAANATGPALLAAQAAAHDLTLVHVSSDYVFDGTRAEHDESEELAPLGVYGQSKAAGDLAVAVAPRHYVVRTSWVIGEGANFVRTMRRLAEQGVSPRVVDDQVGRLTFTDELVRGILHLLGTEAAYGVYHLTNGGPSHSWADYARAVFEASGRAASEVTPVSTEEYVAGQDAAGRDTAPRPLHSTLSLEKIEATGFVPVDSREALDGYLRELAQSTEPSA